MAINEMSALITEPSSAIGIEALPDVAVLSIHSRDEAWASQLEGIMSGGIVLGFRKMVLDLQHASLSSAFQVACLVSAWHLLVNAEGTLAISGLSAAGKSALGDEHDPALFNLFMDADEALDWLERGFDDAIKRSLPRACRCGACGAEGKVEKRGNYLCDNCGLTYLVTEKGELPF